MRAWISRDCTGEPPGELTTNATTGASLFSKARCSWWAQLASERPGLSGEDAAVIMPERRTTGITTAFLRKRAGMRELSFMSAPAREMHLEGVKWSQGRLIARARSDADFRGSAK